MGPKKKLIPPVRKRGDVCNDDSSAVSQRNNRDAGNRSPKERERPNAAVMSRGRRNDAIQNSSADVATSAVRGECVSSSHTGAVPEATTHRSQCDIKQCKVFMLSCECRVNPKFCRRLSLVCGALVRLKARSAECFLEIFLSHTTPDGCVEVNPQIYALLNSDSAEISIIEGKEAVSVADQVMVTFELENKHSNATQVIDPTVLVSLCSLLRDQFHQRVLFAGCRVALKFMTYSVEAEVESICTLNKAPVQFALVGDRTAIRSGSPSTSCTEAENATSHETEVKTGANVMLIGERGTGKSYTLAREMDAARVEGRAVFEVRIHELPQAEESGIATCTALMEVVEQAKRSAPAMVVIDDLDTLVGDSADGGGGGGTQWSKAVLLRVFRSTLSRIKHSGVDVMFAASATNAEAVASLLSPDCFSRQTRLMAPSSPAERLAVLRSCIADCSGGSSFCDDTTKGDTDDAHQQLNRVAEQTHGFTQRDLRMLVEHAKVLGFRETFKPTFRVGDVLSALKYVHPSSLKQFEVSVPEVTWGDIGGSQRAKETLQEIVEWSLGKQSWVFSQFGLQPPRGVLLYGPPGCSKTMLAKALANESKMNFISIKGPEVFSKWVGDSEKAVRNIFTKARAAAPCVVFIDELDGMCSHRGSGGVSDRVISQFLTELDGLPAAMSDRQQSLVFIAATNRPDSIDAAVLRPGRIDRKVLVGLPDVDEREAIVRIQFSRMPTAPELTPRWVAEQTAGYTGAEVVAVVKEAAFTAINENANADFLSRGNVQSALLKVRPRITKKEADWYTNWPESAATVK